MPMPVSDTASSIQWPPFTTLRALSLTSPCLVKRLPVLSRSFRLPGILARFLRLQLQHVYAEQRRWQAALLQLAGQLYSEAHGRAGVLKPPFGRCPSPVAVLSSYAEPLRAGCPMVVEPMRRRQFITLLGGAAATWPVSARAQQSTMPIIGFLGGGSTGGSPQTGRIIRQSLTEAGFIEGRNISVDYRWAEGQYDRLPAMAADLVRRQVAVILAIPAPAARAARAATATIPIVFMI